MTGRSVVTRQLFAFFTAIGGTVLTIAALGSRRWLWAFAFALFTAVAAAGARFWSRTDPGPMPYFMRWILFAPRPYQSPRRLNELLAPVRGERLLEIGPGIGVHAIPVARSVGPDGRLDVLDVQQEMLEELMQRAESSQLTNIVPCRGDAGRLPYPDRGFDGAYLISVLGEVPDPDAALQELHRVLKSNGRLVIGELFVDPDFIGPNELQQRVARASFTFERSVGPPLAYLARFRRT